MRLITFFIYLLLFTLSTFAQENKKPAKPSKKDFVITISTSFGDMVLLLYDETPKHKANFVKLAKEGFYNDLLFHRVIKEFMIQGGDPDSKNAKEGEMLGRGGLDYRVDAEFVPKIYHKKGVIAAARDNNPAKASSSCQFYIVQGKKFMENDLSTIEQRLNIKYTDAQKEVYKTLGGTPHLDQNYTVFGEVIKGIEVVDKIALVETDPNDRPKKDVRMQLKIEEMPKKKITKLYGFQYPEAK